MSTLKPKINVNLPQCIVISAAQNGIFEQFGFVVTVTTRYALTEPNRSNLQVCDKHLKTPEKK